MATKKEIEYVISETFGSEAIPIGFYLIGKKNISEFVIAKDLDIEIHKIRQILYKLLEDHIVTFIRKKDKVKGWYICYWSLNKPEFPFIIRKIKQKKLAKLKARLEQETNDDFYMCKNACTRMDFDNAFELNFKCPDCGEIMNMQSGKRTIEFLKERITELEKEIGTDLLVADTEETKEKIKERKKVIKSSKKPKKKKSKSKKLTKKKETSKSKTTKKKKPKKKKSTTKNTKTSKTTKKKKGITSLFKKKK